MLLSCQKEQIQSTINYSSHQGKLVSPFSITIMFLISAAKMINPFCFYNYLIYTLYSVFMNIPGKLRHLNKAKNTSTSYKSIFKKYISQCRMSSLSFQLFSNTRNIGGEKHYIGLIIDFKL